MERGPGCGCGRGIVVRNSLSSRIPSGYTDTLLLPEVETDNALRRGRSECTFVPVRIVHPLSFARDLLRASFRGCCFAVPVSPPSGSPEGWRPREKKMGDKPVREALLGRLAVEVLLVGHGFLSGLMHRFILVLGRGVDRVELEVGGL